MSKSTAKTPLRALLVEDSEIDAELLVHELERAGFAVSSRRVQTEVALREALRQPDSWDIIFSDYAMPGFDGMQALKIAKAHSPEVPFLLVSGTVGEETAVEAMLAGANDYFIKDRLARLGPAVARELREAAERHARRQSEEQVRLLFHAVRQAPVSLLITDTAGNIEYVNPKFTEVSGYTLEEVRGKNPRLLKSGLTPPAIYVNLWKTITAGSEWRGELQNRGKNGELYWESISISPIRDAEGKITHFLGAKLDITEKRTAEKMILEQGELLDKANDAIYVRTLDRVIRYWNQGAERLYGWTAAEVLGHHISDLRLQGNPPHEIIEPLLRQKGDWTGERRQSTKSGREVTVFSRMTLVRKEDEKSTLVFVINTDISEKKQLEERFLRAQRLENLGALAGGIAHDLNDVLSPVLLAASLLREKLRDEPERHMLATMEASARRGSDIVRQILMFARGIQGERMPLQVRHLLREIEQIILDTFPKNIRVEIHAPRDLWAVLGDGTQLHQALMNLCVNARDAMPQGGELTLTAENISLDEAFVAMTPGAKIGAHIRLCVSDTGTGIPPEHREKIFEPFFTTKEPGKGTGLGLATVQGIVRGHGGFIQLQSTVGKGTRFEIYLPAEPATQMPLESDAGETLGLGHGELILVVDDEVAVRLIATKVLEKHGYKVLAASDGSEALVHFMQHRASIAAVVTDMMMPGMDGPTLVRVLRRINPDIPILGISGVGSMTRIEEIEALALPAFLTKPFNAEKLLLTLHEIMRKPQPAGGPAGQPPTHA